MKSPVKVTASFKPSRSKAGTATIKVVGLDAKARGTVKVYAGRRVVGTAKVSSTGVEKVRVARLKKGTHTRRARFRGSSTTYATWSTTKRIRLR